MAVVCSLGLGACSQSESPVVEPTPTPPVQSTQSALHLNQIGFLPDSVKQAVIAHPQPGTFSITRVLSGNVVMTGNVPAGQVWPVAGEPASLIDFSVLSEPGDYFLTVDGEQLTERFQIGDDLFDELHKAAIKGYYFNRASTDLPEVYAGAWHRAGGHPDTQVLVHESAATDERPAGSVISAPKGWYDAGDYNKYIVNSGISTYTLMRAYLDNKGLYDGLSWNIPESANSRPDMLDEIDWNLSWMLAMQDLDGGVYHKLTTLNFSGIQMPDDATETRYVVQKGTAASLNFAAVFAMASRLYPEQAQTYLEAARRAWQWAQQNPDVVYRNPADVKTGEYGDERFADEFSWAAAELYLATQDSDYLQAFWQQHRELTTPSWSDTQALGYVSLLSDGQSLLSQQDYQRLQDAITGYARTVASEYQDSPYGVAMTAGDFVWGSNGVALNKAMMMWKAWQLTGNTSYQSAARGLLDYVLGRNPLGTSYVTGFGDVSPMHIHHRPSEADDVVAPVPGFIAGGAQNGHQDPCRYASDLPALSYLDDWCSYSTNEITINWNAPLVYMLAVSVSEGQSGF